MSVNYSAVLWNPYKKRYDLILLLFILSYIIGFIGLTNFLHPDLIMPTILIRTFGTLAFLLLHIILSIGPLARLNPRFLPLLYNRRHLGVTMFLMASIHAIFSLVWFHGFSDLDPIFSLFSANTHYNSLVFFPFQVLGFLAYVIFMLMAVTSHDFWLNFLSPKIWKGLHMMVYLAYGLVIMHVVLGVIQFEDSPILFSLLLLGLVTILTLHIWAGWKELKFDATTNEIDALGWVYVCDHRNIPNNRAKMLNIDGERVAVFKYDDKLSAVHNVCKHQNGPLGEGKIIDGCITCPWHGYQYLPNNGKAPAPFTETLATYRLKLNGDAVYINPVALPEGTEVEPVSIPRKENTKISAEEFFVGWLGQLPKSYKQVIRKFIPSAFLLGFTVIALIGFQSNKIRKSSYNYEDIQSFTGELRASPFPMLRTFERDAGGNRKVITYPLVNEGKHGVKKEVARFLSRYSEGTRMNVQLKGRVITRDGQVAMELADVEDNLILTRLEAMIPQLLMESPKDTTLEGQIIDPKCYLGVMNPGEGKPHRACAINCIRGGITPAFITENSPEKSYYVLLGENGQAINKEILFAVAEPLRIHGKVGKVDNWNVIYLNPERDIERLHLLRE